MADDILSVGVEDGGYSEAIKNVIKLNEELESQLNRTGEALKINNKNYEDAIKRLRDLYSMMGKVGGSKGSDGGSKGSDGGNGDILKGISGLKGMTGNNMFNSTLERMGKLIDLVGRDSKGKLNIENYIKGFEDIGKSLGAFNIILLATATALSLAIKAGESAHRTTLKMQQSLMSYGESAGRMGENSIDVANKMNESSVTIRRWGESVSASFEGLFNNIMGITANFVTVLDGIGKKISDIDVWLAKEIAKGAGYDYSNIGNSGKTSFSGIAEGLGLTDSEYTSAISSIVSGSRELGFSLDSLKEMAENTLTVAYEVGQRYGESTVSVIENITDAWQKGSNAASKYGVVVTDDVLAGWAALEKGIDIVNVQYSDAAIQGLRYELAMKQLSTTNSNMLQNNIQLWKQQGALINQNKNNLSSFEEVLKVSGYNPIIPDIEGTKVVGLTDEIDDLEAVRDTLDEIKDKDIKVKTGWLPSENLKAFFSWLDNPQNVVLQAEADILKSQFESLSEYTSNKGTLMGQEFGANFVGAWLSELEAGKAIATNVGLNSLVTGASGFNTGESPLGGLSVVIDEMPNTVGSKGLSVSEKAYNAGYTFGKSLLNSEIFTSGPKLLSGLAGHADGGISTKQHIAMISEGNSAEAIIPLNNTSANPAYEQIASALSKQLVGLVDNGQTIINVAPNSTVIGNQAGLKQLADLIDRNIAIQRRNRGELDYGLRK